jgi:hypothetical protein
VYLNTRGLALIFAGFTLLPYSACGDEILLKNGRTIQGDVISSSGSLLEVRTSLGTVSLRQEDVESVSESELPADFFQDTQDLIPAPEKPVPAEEAVSETPKQPGASGNMAVTDFGIICYYSEEQKLINVEGKTTLPDGALIDVTVGGAGGFVLNGRCMSGNGMFDISFKTSGLNIVKGDYRAEAVLDPDNQDPDYRKKSGSTGLVKRSECFFRIGSEGEIRECAESARRELEPLVKESVELYSGINDFMNGRLQVPNAVARSDWLDKWSSRLKILKRSIVKFRESKCASGIYYPYTQRNIAATADCLGYLYRDYFRESKRASSKDKNGTIGSVVTGPASLNRECGDRIKKMRQELSAQTGGDRDGEKDKQ